MKLAAPTLVRANAGTGKTFALSNQFLKIIFAGEQPKRILATTFTKKAAGEIRTRIFERLAKAALSPEGAAKLATELSNPGITAEKALELLTVLVRDQSRLAICTIDSLCVQMLSLFSAELGFPAGVGVSSHEQDSAAARAAVQEIINRHDSQELFQLLRMISDGRDRRALHRVLEEKISGLHELFMQAPSEAWAGPRPLERLTDSELVELKAELKMLPVGMTANEKPSTKHISSVASIGDQIDRRDWGAVLGTGLSKAVFHGKREFSRVEIPPALYSALERLVNHAKASLVQVVIDQTGALGQLLAVYDEAYWEYRLRTGVLGFSDIKQLLAEASLGGNLDELYYRLDTRYGHLLLDEFQDTSALDWRLLQPIAAEVLSKFSAEYSFLCVGDAKQAIYGFRGGVAEIFDTITETWPDIQERTLACSYRSASTIMEFSNSLFGRIADNSALALYSESAARWQSRYAEHSTARADLQGYVRVERCGPGDQQQGDDELLVAAAVRQVLNLQKEGGGLSIAVLVPRNQDVRTMIRALAAPGVDIQASEEGGVPLTDSAAVLACLSLFVLVDHPGDSIARFHLSNSPLGPLLGLDRAASDNAVATLATELRRRLAVEGYGALLHRLIVGTKEAWGEVATRQLDKLVDLAFTFDSRRGARALDFVRLVEQAKPEQPQGGCIRVMTYHKSKGLEFDAVVLPFAHRAALKNAGSVLVDRATPISPPRLIISGVKSALEEIHPQIADLAEASRAERLIDLLNLLYVAVTRPRQGLYVMLPEVAGPAKEVGSRYPTHAEIIAAAFGLDSGNSTVFENGNPNWYRDRVTSESQANSSSTLPSHISLAATTKRVRSTTFIAPSSLEGGEDRKVSQFLFVPSAGREEGSIFHAMFEELDWLPFQEDMAGRLSAILTSRGIAPDMATHYLREFHRMLDYPVVKDILSKQHASSRTELYRELTFSLREGQQLLRGAIDRVVVYRNGEQVEAAEVIDYKTDSIEKSELANRADIYRPQVEVYRKAVSRLFRLTREQVGVRLLFTRIGEVVEC